MWFNYHFIITSSPAPGGFHFNLGATVWFTISLQVFFCRFSNFLGSDVRIRLVSYNSFWNKVIPADFPSLQAWSRLRFRQASPPANYSAPRNVAQFQHWPKSNNCHTNIMTMRATSGPPPPALCKAILMGPWNCVTSLVYTEFMVKSHAPFTNGADVDGPWHMQVHVAAQLICHWFCCTPMPTNAEHRSHLDPSHN